MESKAFGRKNVEVVQEEESKKNQMVGEESYKKQVGVEAGDITNEDEFKKFHLRFFVKMHNDSLNEAVYFSSKTNVTPNEEHLKKLAKEILSEKIKLETRNLSFLIFLGSYK